MKFLILICTFNFFNLFLFAQQKEISGIVLDGESKKPLPGATIIVKGTQVGAITDDNGKFKIHMPSGKDTIVISFYGYKTEIIDIGNKSYFEVVLNSETIFLDEIFVTALGITKKDKSIGYSIYNLKSDDLLKNRTPFLLSSIQSKVAGITISSSSGAPGSSIRMITRGINSFSSSCQPLIIVDGIPLNNSFSGSTSIDGGIDLGNGLNDLNVDDIESISIMNGSSGAALYGSRASNGVIIITTRKGTSERFKINFNTSISFENPLRLVKYQNEFGQGIYGNAVNYENMSWGPKFDNKMHYWGHEVDNALRVKPYRALPNNVKEFFDTGILFNNSLSFSRSNDNNNFFASFSNVIHDGIFPTNADNYNRNTLTLKGQLLPSKKLQFGISLSYIKTIMSVITTGQGEQSVYNQIMQTPRDISLLELQDIDSKWNNIDNFYSFYTVNPYFILKKNGNKNNEDRIIGNFEVDYSFIKNFSILMRFGADIENSNFKLWRTKIEPSGNNKFASIYDPGLVHESFNHRWQMNSDVILKYKVNLDKLNFNILTGCNVNSNYGKSYSAEVRNLIIPELYALDNSNELPVVNSSLVQYRLFGLYTNIEFEFKNIIFLNFSARNDWSSTLPINQNSYFYPGINSSIIFSDILQLNKNILSYGKLRFSATTTGNDASPYQIYNVFIKASHSDGLGFLRYPLPNGINSFELSNLLGNENLKPELTTEYEIGTDLKMVNSRISMSFTLYKKITTNLIWPVPIPSSSGFTNKIMNLGKITNKGMEILLNINQIKRRNFEWSISTTFSLNRNRLDKLYPGLDKVVFNALTVEGGQQIHYSGKPGRPIGIFEGRGVKRNEEGKIIVDNNGLPVADEKLKEYGDREYKYISGITNNFSSGHFSLQFTFDIRQGGKIYSRTKEISLWAGTVPVTLYNMREPFIIPDAVYEIGRDENNKPIYAENTIPINCYRLVNYWGNGGLDLDGSYIIDKSFIKLREVILSYDIPQKILKFIKLKNLRLNVIGRNLFIITPPDQTYVDPELTTFGTGINGDFGEFGATPTVKSFTVSLQVEF